VTHMDKEFARLKIPFKEEFRHVYGGVHGGVIASVGDAAGGAALTTSIPVGHKIATIEITINYVSPVKEEILVAEGKIIRKGSRIGVGEIKIKTDPGGRLVAVGLATYMILARKRSSTHGSQL